MKRRVITIAIFVLAGAVVNVGVAWGYVLMGNYLLPKETVERLAALREKGHLSDEEFESQKRKILGG